MGMSCAQVTRNPNCKYLKKKKKKEAPLQLFRKNYKKVAKQKPFPRVCSLGPHAMDEDLQERLFKYSEDFMLKRRLLPE